MKWNNSFALIIVLCLSQFVFGQESKKSEKPVTITGKVLTPDNKPVAGAVLYIDNIKTGTITKNNGTYKIKVSPSAISLEVRSTEFGNSVVAINGMTLINFLLTGGIEALKPGDKSKDATVKPAKRAKKMNTYNNIYDMIRCEVNGVIVSGKNIQIQQAHSFFGSGTPLFVVNGNIVPSIDNLDPVEVKSIGLLKGSAAAIYGVNGSNGVITITLKNGTEKDQ
jgi:hypothetical protein